MSETIILIPIYQPNIEFLKTQISSLTAQTYTSFVCLLSYDGIPNSQFLEFLPEILSDSRFISHEFEERVGVYKHVERMLKLVNPKFEFIFLCDQDDLWNPTKIESQLSSLKSNDLKFISDNALLVNENNSAINEMTLFDWLGISDESLQYSLISNCVTGAGSAFKFEVIEKALPFPVDKGKAFHDHWLSIVGLALGKCELRPIPSWSYRQHSNNAVGAYRNNSGRMRSYLAIKKIKSIWDFQRRQPFDQIAEQIKEFETEIFSRVPHPKSQLLMLCQITSLRVRFSLLKPKHLLRSRFETFRLFLMT